jgi:hypothetical protein
LSDTIANEFQNAEVLTVNQRTVMWETLEQIDSPRSRQSVWVKSHQKPRIQNVSTFSAAGEPKRQFQNELTGSLLVIRAFN